MQVQSEKKISQKLAKKSPLKKERTKVELTFAMHHIKRAKPGNAHLSHHHEIPNHLVFCRKLSLIVGFQLKLIQKKIFLFGCCSSKVFSQIFHQIGWWICLELRKIIPFMKCHWTRHQKWTWLNKPIKLSSVCTQRLPVSFCLQNGILYSWNGENQTR